MNEMLNCNFKASYLAVDFVFLIILVRFYLFILRETSNRVHQLRYLVASLDDLAAGLTETG